MTFFTVSGTLMDSNAIMQILNRPMITLRNRFVLRSDRLSAYISGCTAGASWSESCELLPWSGFPSSS
jgi:hypothetical protein